MVYLILVLPAAFMCYRLASGEASAGDLLHGSGEFSARLLIVALAATPLRQLWPEARWTRWLIRNRRPLGIMAFAYAFLHTVFYVIDMQTLALILAEIGALGIWTGWLGFGIFLPLALTSNNASVRLLGASWQRLHRLVYVAAVATLVHWIFVHNNALAAWVHFAPLIILEVIRVRKTVFG